MSLRIPNKRSETVLRISHAQSLRPGLGLGVTRNLEIPFDTRDGLRWGRVLSMGGGCDDPDHVQVRVQAIDDLIPA